MNSFFTHHIQQQCKNNNQFHISHYLYIVKCREFIKSNELILKIGKTKQENLARFNSYPTGSQLLFHMVCDDCDVLEKIIIQLFKKKYIHRNDIGYEYFEGNYLDMIDDMYEQIVLFRNKSKNENNIQLCNINFNDFNYVP
jgi:hypothetical protein